VAVTETFDPLDVGHLVLVALRRPAGEQVVALGHMRVGVHHSQTFSQLEHGYLP